jgi:hypothetical protein
VVNLYLIKETTLEYLDPTDDSIRRFCPVLTYWPFCPIPLWNDDNYALLRQTPDRRLTFFDAIRALTRYMVFASGHHLMDFMTTGLELKPELDTG